MRKMVKICSFYVGADLTVQNQEGETPLQMAELSNHVEVVKILRDAMRTGVDKPDGENTHCDCMGIVLLCSYTSLGNVHILA